jgi:hypothetical protein
VTELMLRLLNELSSERAVKVLSTRPTRYDEQMSPVSDSASVAIRRSLSSISSSESLLTAADVLLREPARVDLLRALRRKWGS